MPDGKKAVGAHARGQVVIVLHTQNFFEDSSFGHRRYLLSLYHKPSNGWKRWGIQLCPINGYAVIIVGTWILIIEQSAAKDYVGFRKEMASVSTAYN